MKRRRLAPAVNAGSMADIAFLLLIFFLVATQIANDKGIPVLLPEYYEGPVGQAADNNVLNILINAQDELLIEKELAKKEEVRARVKAFVLNKNQSRQRPSRPDKAIISIQNDKSTTYEAYIDIYSQVQAAYKDMRNELAQARFATNFDELILSQKKEIAAAIPMKISEADPF